MQIYFQYGVGNANTFANLLLMSLHMLDTKRQIESISNHVALAEKQVLNFLPGIKKSHPSVHPSIVVLVSGVGKDNRKAANLFFLSMSSVLFCPQRLWEDMTPQPRSLMITSEIDRRDQRMREARCVSLILNWRAQMA